MKPIAVLMALVMVALSPGLESYAALSKTTGSSSAKSAIVPAKNISLSSPLASQNIGKGLAMPSPVFPIGMTRSAAVAPLVTAAIHSAQNPSAAAAKDLSVSPKTILPGATASQSQQAQTPNPRKSGAVEMAKNLEPYLGKARNLKAISTEETAHIGRQLMAESSPEGYEVSPARLNLFKDQGKISSASSQLSKPTPDPSGQKQNAVEISPPAARAAAPQGAGRGWAIKAAALVGIFLALDWGMKLLFVHAGLPFVYHPLGATRLLIMKLAIPINLIATTYYLSLAKAKTPPLAGLWRWKEAHPILGGALYAFLRVLTFPVGLGEQRYAGDLPDRHPALRTAQRIVLFTSAAVVAASLGNGLEAILRSKVVDFIPFGHGRMNLADSYIFFGLPLLWMTLDLFAQARKSEATKRPITFRSSKYYWLPILGFVTFVYSTIFGYDAIPMPAWYVLLFSTLFSIGIYTADFVVQRLVEAYNNRQFRPDR